MQPPLYFMFRNFSLQISYFITFQFCLLKNPSHGQDIIQPSFNSKFIHDQRHSHKSQGHTSQYYQQKLSFNMNFREEKLFKPQYTPFVTLGQFSNSSQSILPKLLKPWCLLQDCQNNSQDLDFKNKLIIDLIVHSISLLPLEN